MPKKGKAKGDASQREICFVIMPFGGWLDDYYQEIYCPAIKDAGLEAHRADDLFRPSTIVNDIWAYTKRARLLLADLSGKTPNVFYELGLAHALAKPAILVAESIDDVPFDLRALRILLFDKNAPDWGKILGEKVKTSIGEVLKSPAEAVLPAFLDTKGASPRPAVTAQEKEIMEIRQKLDLLTDKFVTESKPIARNRIDAEEAIGLVRKYVKIGMPDDMIIDRLNGLGVPSLWVKDRIRNFKGPIVRRRKD